MRFWGGGEWLMGGSGGGGIGSGEGVDGEGEGECLERCTVTVRVKEPYSLWRKLVKRRLRIVVGLGTGCESGESQGGSRRAFHIPGQRRHRATGNHPRQRLRPIHYIHHYLSDRTRRIPLLLSTQPPAPSMAGHRRNKDQRLRQTP